VVLVVRNFVQLVYIFIPQITNLRRKKKEIKPSPKDEK
jgi:hypothetical protein